MNRIAGVLGVSSRLAHGEDRVGIEILDSIDVELPGVGEDGMSGRNVQRKLGTTRGSPRALPHSEGITYKPPCGEIAMCLRVGRMGPIK